MPVNESAVPDAGVNRFELIQLLSHLQDVIHGLRPKGPARVEQSVARLLHFVLFPPRGLGVPRQRPLQTFAAALKLLTYILEPTHIPGKQRNKLI